MGPSNPWSPNWQPDPTGRRLLTIRAARRGAFLAAGIYLPIAVVAALDAVRTPAVMQVYLTSATALVRGDDATVREGRLEFTVPGGSYYVVTGTP